MKKIFLICLTFFLGILPSYSETCKGLTVMEMYSLSDLIFMGEIKAIQDGYFEVKIIESLKGTLQKEEIIKVKANNHYHILNVGKKWIFYLQKMDNNVVQMLGCGWSKSIHDGTEIYFIPPPPPYSSNSTIISDEFINYLNEVDSKIYEALNSMKARQEIITLRGLRNQKSIEFLEASNQKLKKYFSISLIVFSALLLFLFFRPSKTPR